MRPATVILLAVVTTAALADEIPVRKDGDFLPPEHFLNPESAPATKVLLVGTWHFAYPGLDAHVTEESNRVDVLSDKRQAEMSQVLGYLERFEPDTIALECPRNSDYGERYQRFLDGKLEEQRDERYQIGFRLAKRIGLEEIHCTDAGSFAEDHEQTIRDLGAIPEAYDFQSDDEMRQRYDRWSEYRDRLAKNATLLEGLRYMNRDDVLDAGYGAYLVGDFKLGEHGGADALSLYWYNRNLRIFRNIQQLADQGRERILVLFGAGHVQILKDLVESSPEYERVPFEGL